MAKSRTRLRVQLISARGVFDAAQRLTRLDAAQTLDAELDDEPAAPEADASDVRDASHVGKERPVVPPEARRRTSGDRRSDRPA